ncbi:MAG: helix-turn-helix transcriptional regulator [Candidatus Kaiserbacteria bacterium]|nr:MAG: helix-turn-helix transcriptional regulator [Candidatus Kaiserbacteria bacterium]
MLRTKKQREDLCADCPVARVADLLGDACSLLVVRDLLDGPRRFGHLDESLGMSTRTLTKTLRRLERRGLVARTALKRLPPYVEYRLTSQGRALRKVVDEMRTYGKKYL